MVNGLRAGYSTSQAMEAISKELPPPINDEFRRVVLEMQIGITMELHWIICFVAFQAKTLILSSLR